jgi:hypothetical protein
LDRGFVPAYVYQGSYVLELLAVFPVPGEAARGDSEQSNEQQSADAARLLPLGGPRVHGDETLPVNIV